MCVIYLFTCSCYNIRIGSWCSKQNNSNVSKNLQKESRGKAYRVLCWNKTKVITGEDTGVGSWKCIKISEILWNFSLNGKIIRFGWINIDCSEYWWEESLYDEVLFCVFYVYVCDCVLGKVEAMLQSSVLRPKMTIIGILKCWIRC